MDGKQFDDLKELGFRKEVVWGSAFTLLREHALEERACRIRDFIPRPEFRRILETLGPTDAGLLHIAEIEKATLLTEDWELIRFAHERSVPVLSLKQIASA